MIVLLLELEIETTGDDARWRKGPECVIAEDLQLDGAVWIIAKLQAFRDFSLHERQVEDVVTRCTRREWP